ncbi:hypothetical protein SSP2390 [Staphylococcus saprophyticus subsp. saprophyticus ATCC 15305]|uniref:Uncharacterized protein n=1 Tax=Staphylococcus saprophyticus subsp. saprophyticus (strain ATCC 15305 / DSM 20229 / NCIMB 8711 / NCTC 7292 / S-41) TaxID=342451 RepID=Q49UN5_STAS1|nr:hypothetical protein SSP2390 [Staphylococcus saprophyticus subsp. saprophyticus ATCC 15305] [Staphylococcus saprophyticus subsp. saprophyticus ATCC 15305 = NCTC 7292]
MSKLSFRDFSWHIRHDITFKIQNIFKISCSCIIIGKYSLLSSRNHIFLHAKIIKL